MCVAYSGRGMYFVKNCNFLILLNVKLLKAKKAKLDFALEQTMKAQRGRRVVALLFL
jgi:hypothetical protein